MAKGILHIKQKPRHIISDGKQISIRKEVPEIGKEYDKLECEFEGNPAFKIIVGGAEFSADVEALNAKKAKREQEEAKRKEEEQKQRERDKQQNSNNSSNNSKFDVQHAQVPKQVRDILENQEIDNFYLKLNRLARFEQNKKGEWKFILYRKNSVEVTATFNNAHIKAIAAKHKKQAKILLDQSLIISNFTPNWRLIVGLGGESVYETSITLHHVYGFPYIPASSIKGVLRSFIIAEKFENHEGKAIADKDFCDVFGCSAEVSVEEDGKKKPFASHYKEARQGTVTFFDALPTQAPNIEPDIMNPHYGDWYGNKKDRNGPIPPTDTQSPVPVFFLTVKGTFQFLFGSKKMNITDKFWNDKTLSEWLTEALTQHGIGAKTAVGYGYMKEVTKQ